MSTITTAIPQGRLPDKPILIATRESHAVWLPSMIAANNFTFTHSSTWQQGLAFDDHYGGLTQQRLS